MVSLLHNHTLIWGLFDLMLHRHRRRLTLSGGCHLEDVAWQSQPQAPAASKLSDVTNEQIGLFDKGIYNGQRTSATASIWSQKRRGLTLDDATADSQRFVTQGTELLATSTPSNYTNSE